MRLPLLKGSEEIDVKQVNEMVDLFIKRGFTYFDTAYMYMNYKSECIAKECLVNRYPRDSFTIASKLPTMQLKKVEDMEVGDNEKLTAIITPSNATDKNITWKSSDESIATIDSTGEVIAKKSGTVDITATTSNGKSNTITINIKEPINVQKNYTTNSLMEKNDTVANDVVENTTDNEEGSSALGGIVTLAILGGGGYWGYKKYKNKKEKV